MKILLKWFRVNSLKANPDKFQFMILGKKKRNRVKLMINSTEIGESKKVVLLGITIDNLLTFNEHNDKLCRTGNYKLHKMKYLSLEKAKLLWNGFIINSQLIMPYWFGCFAEKTIFKDSEDSPQSTKGGIYQKLKMFVHQRHLRVLICEFFKSLNNLNPEFMWSYFIFKNIIQETVPY